MYVGSRTCVRRGYSCSPDPAQAVRELSAAIYRPDTTLAVFFASTEYDLHALERELNRRFADVPLIGCTSAGEITPAGYLSGGIVGFSLARPDFVSVSTTIDDLRHISIVESHAIVRSLRNQLEHEAPGFLPNNTFAFLLIDGLCKCEEVVLSAIASALGDVPLFGGSSGGALNFQRSYVFDRGRFQTEAAVLALVHTRAPFRLFTIDHFVNSDTKMVVTEADPASRIVTEINAEPAGPEYARLLGLGTDKLTPMIFATHPVVVKVGGRYYTRSIQKVNEDGSLTFFCAIDKGVVLTVAQGTDLLSSVAALFAEIRGEMGPPQLVIGCDCVLRALELERQQQKQEVGRLFADNNVIGFSTFGEQFQAMHVNQTFTGAAIGTGRIDRLP
jgi:hypothetical protein